MLLMSLLASVCSWVALLLIGAASVGLLRHRVGVRGRCLVLRSLRLPDWLLRTIQRWLQLQESPLLLEAAEVRSIAIGWSAKGYLFVGVRGFRVVLEASSGSSERDAGRAQASNAHAATIPRCAGSRPCQGQRAQQGGCVYAIVFEVLGAVRSAVISMQTA